MESYPTTLMTSSVCGGDVAELVIRRPQSYVYRPGQWFRLILQTAEGEQAKIFSHASTPAEPDLLMATRLSPSTFKQALAALRPGDAVTIQGPGGRLGLPEHDARPVCLTGGVGITPVRSLLRDAAETGTVFGDAVVFYATRTRDCAPYEQDLAALAPVGVRLVRVVETPDPDWSGERGFIDADLIRRHVEDAETRAYLVTGPPPMVSAMEAALDALGVPGDKRIVERFADSPSRPPATEGRAT